MRCEAIARRVAVEGGAIEWGRSGRTAVAGAIAIGEEEEAVHSGLAVAAAEAIRAVRRIEASSELGHGVGDIAATVVIATTGRRVEQALGGNTDHHTERGPGVEVTAIAVPGVAERVVVLRLRPQGMGRRPRCRHTAGRGSGLLHLV